MFDVRTYGNVPEEFITWVLNVLSEVYSVCDKAPSIVEVNVYETRTLYEYKMIYDAFSGVGVLSLETYMASHDAWTGIPRVHVIYEVYYEVDKRIYKSAVIHEAIHTVLHGSLEAYVASIPDSLRRLNVKHEVLWRILSLIASGIKDYEVVNYIVEHNIDPNVCYFISYNLNMLSDEIKRLKVYDVESKAQILSVVFKDIASPIALIHRGLECKDVLEALRGLTSISNYISPFVNNVLQLPRDYWVCGDLQHRINRFSNILVKHIITH